MEDNRSLEFGGELARLEAAENYEFDSQNVSFVTPGWLLVVGGGEVAVLHQGVLVDRHLVEPKLFSVGEATMLMYRYENGGRGGAWVPHDQVQARGQDWHYAFWNPTTGEIRDADTVDGSF